jgi:hypothetical protein
MTNQERPTFPHRHNRDGIVDSICSECLVTIASTMNERDLERQERAHICDPLRLYQLGADPGRRSLISANRMAL